MATKDEETLKATKIEMNKNNVRKKVYPTDRNKMGRCLIINNVNFVGSPKSERRGAKEDAERLEIVFKNLGFDVESLLNVPSQRMLAAIQEQSRMKDNEERSAFVLIIMSHGGEGFVWGTEPGGTLNVKDIVVSLNNKNCPELKDKPKLCFFQACNGSERAIALEKKVQEECMSPEEPKPKRYPMATDILLSFAAQEGYKTCRCPSEGGFYINCLADALVKYAYTCEMREILEIVEENIRKIPIEINGDQVCLSTEVKLLGWDGKFYFYPQQQGGGTCTADGADRMRPLIGEEPMGYEKTTENPHQLRTALNVISGLCIIGGSRPPEYLSKGGESWRTVNGTGLEGFDYCQAIAYLNNSVYVANNKGILVWIPNSNLTVTIRKFESPRTCYAHAFLNGKIYVLGGQVDDEPNNEFWVYDTQETEWEDREDLSSSCSGRSAVVLRDKFYITPGEEDQLNSKLDTFDPEKHNWSTVPSSMRVKRCWHATATCGTYIWVFGGWKNTKLNVCKDVERYNFKTRNWEEMAPMLTARSHLSVTYFNGEFYATGGVGEKGTDLDVVEIYNLQNDKWTKGKPLVHARSMHNAIVIEE